jgi:hypothetical protein
MDNRPVEIRSGKNPKSKSAASMETSCVIKNFWSQISCGARVKQGNCRNHQDNHNGRRHNKDTQYSSNSHRNAHG